jgi:hypothetical protein
VAEVGKGETALAVATVVNQAPAFAAEAAVKGKAAA